MSIFTDTQVKALKGKLRAADIKTREEDGITLSYIEGWFTISEANRIFGFDGWSRETREAACVWQGRSQGRAACNYIARVRISIHGEAQSIIREGSGFGGGSGETLGEAHEMALKEAETDAMKRAFMTFGNRFGLALYDPEQKGVSKPRAKPQEEPPHWPVSLPGETASILCNTPQAVYGELRKALEGLTSIESVQDLWHRNESTLKALREAHPHLTDQHGAHYTAVFARLCKQRVKALMARGDTGKPAGRETPPPAAGEISTRPAAPSSPPAINGRQGDRGIDKSVLAIGAPRRIRDPNHLKYVASQPCLVCGRQPAQAHHLTFAQPRGRGLKSSDEWTVPLCALHHRELHDRGDERAYWEDKNIDAEKVARELWEKRRGLGLNEIGEERKTASSSLGG
ncbi:MAG TPA: Rad52/Rad22 family DNA repair protein [Acidobacteriota bacterium]|nr:Rad52/Rad22 family DNA repair protein [Acidobacteriota bacterium]